MKPSTDYTRLCCLTIPCFANASYSTLHFYSQVFTNKQYLYFIKQYYLSQEGKRICHPGEAEKHKRMLAHRCVSVSVSACPCLCVSGGGADTGEVSQILNPEDCSMHSPMTPITSRPPSCPWKLTVRYQYLYNTCTHTHTHTGTHTHPRPN